MSKKIDRRSFLKVLGIAGAACAMTALTGCDDEGVPVIPAGDGSVPLSNLKPLNGVFKWGNVAPEDPFGKTYTNGANSIVLWTYSDAWNSGTNDFGETYRGIVEYSVDKKYKKLTMKLNPYKDMEEKGWSMVNIYADDKIVGTSPVIKQKTKETETLEVDITNAEYIKIEPIVSNSYYAGHGSLILWDVKLWK